MWLFNVTSHILISHSPTHKSHTYPRTKVTLYPPVPTHKSHNMKSVWSIRKYSYTLMLNREECMRTPVSPALTRLPEFSGSPSAPSSLVLCLYSKCLQSYPRESFPNLFVIVHFALFGFPRDPLSASPQWRQLQHVWLLSMVQSPLPTPKSGSYVFSDLETTISEPDPSRPDWNYMSFLTYSTLV